MEAIIGAVLVSKHELIPVPKKLIDTLFGLGMGRVVTLTLMVVLMARWQYKLRPESGSDEEGRSLLQNGDGATNGYGGTNGRASGPPAKAGPPTTQGVGWFDYFAGFKVLFPYLW